MFEKLGSLVARDEDLTDVLESLFFDAFAEEVVLHLLCKGVTFESFGSAHPAIEFDGVVDVSLASESGEGVVTAAIFFASTKKGKKEEADDTGSVSTVGAVEGDWGLIGFGDLIEDSLIDIGESGETGAFGAGWDGAIDDFKLPIIAGSWGDAVEGGDTIGVSHIDVDFDAEFFDELFAFGSDVLSVSGVGLVEFATAVVKALFDAGAFD